MERVCRVCGAEALPKERNRGLVCHACSIQERRSAYARTSDPAKRRQRHGQRVCLLCAAKERDGVPFGRTGYCRDCTRRKRYPDRGEKPCLDCPTLIPNKANHKRCRSCARAAILADNRAREAKKRAPRVCAVCGRSIAHRGNAAVRCEACQKDHWKQYYRAHYQKKGWKEHTRSAHFVSLCCDLCGKYTMIINEPGYSQQRYCSKACARIVFKARQQTRRDPAHRFTGQEFLRLCQHYDHRCLCCGATDGALTADHVIPLSWGGTNDIDNIQPLCRSCNARKGARHSTDYRLLV